MPTPRAGYHTSDGTRVPSVTTVISNCQIGGIDGLLAWANRLGLEGKSHEVERDKAADAGTACHAMVEAYALGQEFDRSPYPAEILAKADGAYRAFLTWAEQTQFRIARSEVSLVSERHRYGGTLDCILVHGQRSLGDWKTSNSIRVGMLCQLAAYRTLWDENNPDEKIEGGFHLLKFSKPDHPDDPIHFAHHHWSDLAVAWEAFLHMRELYELNKRLRKLAA